jgi:hypothetical protein
MPIGSESKYAPLDENIAETQSAIISAFAINVIAENYRGQHHANIHIAILSDISIISIGTLCKDLHRAVR